MSASAGGDVSTVAGTGEAGFQDGPAAQAKMGDPRELLYHPAQHCLYASCGNRIRKIAFPPPAPRPPPPPRHLSTLALHLESMLNNPDVSDVVFQVGGRQIHASSHILRTRSERAGYSCWRGSAARALGTPRR